MVTCHSYVKLPEGTDCTLLTKIAIWFLAASCCEIGPESPGVWGKNKRWALAPVPHKHLDSQKSIIWHPESAWEIHRREFCLSSGVRHSSMSCDSFGQKKIRSNQLHPLILHTGEKQWCLFVAIPSSLWIIKIIHTYMNYRYIYSHNLYIYPSMNSDPARLSTRCPRCSM